MRLRRDDTEHMAAGPVAFAHPLSVAAMPRLYFGVAVHKNIICLGMACFEIIEDKLKLGPDCAHVAWCELCRRGRGRECPTQCVSRQERTNDDAQRVSAQPNVRLVHF